MSARHGGAFWEGLEGRAERLGEIVRADVLDAWFPPAPGVLQALYKSLIPACNTSPEIDAKSVVEEIAFARSIPEESVLVGPGASSLIDFALPRWLPGGGPIVVLDPTYSEYPYALCRLNASVRRVAAWPEAPTDESLLAACADAAGAVLVNPNNPTGSFFSAALLEEIANRIPLWIDETYLEYVPKAKSLEGFAAKTPGVVVCKSMSKAYALSGLRVGYAVAHPSTIASWREVRSAWPIGLPAQIAAIEALGNPTYYEGCYRKTALFRNELARAIGAQEAGINCVLVGTQDPPALYEALRRHAVYVRTPDDPVRHPFVRVAVRSLPENESIAHAFRSVRR